MSYSVCIKCSEMVRMYEKYCDMCVHEHKLKQDVDWHKNKIIRGVFINREKEIQKDKKI